MYLKNVENLKKFYASLLNLIFKKETGCIKVVQPVSDMVLRRVCLLANLVRADARIILRLYGRLPRRKPGVRASASLHRVPSDASGEAPHGHPPQT